MRKRAGIVGAFVVMLVVACSGDDDDGSSASETGACFFKCDRAQFAQGCLNGGPKSSRAKCNDICAPDPMVKIEFVPGCGDCSTCTPAWAK